MSKDTPRRDLVGLLPQLLGLVRIVLQHLVAGNALGIPRDQRGGEIRRRRVGAVGDLPFFSVIVYSVLPSFTSMESATSFLGFPSASKPISLENSRPP